MSKMIEDFLKIYTINPEVGDNWELVDNLVAEVVKNIKAKKKAAAAAKRAARK